MFFHGLKDHFNRVSAELTARTDPEKRIVTNRYYHNAPEGSDPNNTKKKDNEMIWYEARRVGKLEYKFYAVTHFADSGRTYKLPLDNEDGRERFSYLEALQFLKFIETKMYGMENNNFDVNQPLSALHYSNHDFPDLPPQNPLTQKPAP